MTSAENVLPGYVIVWVWLVVLLGAGLAVVSLPIPRTAAVALVFGVASLKAGLVVRNYMHLKSEHRLIYAIALVPVLLFVGLLLALIPDIAMRR